MSIGDITQAEWVALIIATPIASLSLGGALSSLRSHLQRRRARAGRHVLNRAQQSVGADQPGLAWEACTCGECWPYAQDPNVND